MADIADKANDHIEREHAGLLMRRKPIGPIATGACLFCDEPFVERAQAGWRWCGAECLSDWLRIQRADAQRAVA